MEETTGGGITYSPWASARSWVSAGSPKYRSSFSSRRAQAPRSGNRQFCDTLGNFFYQRSNCCPLGFLGVEGAKEVHVSHQNIHRSAMFGGGGKEIIDQTLQSLE